VAVYDLYMDPQSNPFLTYDPMDLASFETIYTELLATQTLTVVALHDEVVASYRLIPKTHRQSATCYLGGFVIKNTHQGKGLGTAILLHIGETEKAKGIRRVELTVSLDNAPAIRLYKKVGFDIEGRIRMSYSLASTGQFYDEYLMGWLL